jgi:hypothetical protein
MTNKIRLQVIHGDGTNYSYNVTYLLSVTRAIDFLKRHWLWFLMPLPVILAVVAWKCYRKAKVPAGCRRAGSGGRPRCRP